MSRAFHALDRHWFAPASLRELAAVRVFVVAAQLVLFYPSLGWELWLAGADQSLFAPIPALKVLLLPLGGWGLRPAPMFLHAMWLLGIIAGILAIIGLYTRPSMAAFAAITTLLIAHGYSYGEFHHPEALMVISLWVLAFAPVAEGWSLDALRTRIRVALGRERFQRRSMEEDLSPFARWPVRVIQWLLVLSYLSAAMSKLGNGGLAWFNGHTLAYYWIQDGMRFNMLGLGPSLGIWLSHHLLVGTGLAVVTVLFELTFALAVLIPRTTRFYVLAGTAMHTSIYLVQGAPFFQYIVLYVAFIETVRRTLPRRRRAAAPYTVIYDGLCPLCIRSMVVLDFLDVRRRLQYVDLERDWSRATQLAPDVTPASARHAMHVIAPDGRVYRGFFAFRVLARVLPALWVLLPFYHAPFASTIGPRVYDRIAGARGRAVCRAETCSV